MMRSREAASNDFEFSTESTSTTSVSSLAATSCPLKPTNSVVRLAIKNHLRYLRYRGKTHVSARDVAQALSLSTDEVKRVAVQVGAILED